MHSERGAANAPFFVEKFVVIATPQSALLPACPERGFEPSAPGGRCSEGRIGRNREYCKQQRSKTTIFQPALWLRVQRADGGVAARLLLFASTPQSNLRFASSPAGAPFGCGTSSNPKAVPACGESGTKCRKGNGSKMPSCLTIPPQLRLRSAAPP